jgi:hypothetical protein
MRDPRNWGAHESRALEAKRTFRAARVLSAGPPWPFHNLSLRERRLGHSSAMPAGKLPHMKRKVRTLAGLQRAYNATNNRLGRFYTQPYILQPALLQHLARLDELNQIDDPVARFQAFRLVPSLEYQLETVHSALSPERRKSFAQRVSSNQSLRCRETEFSKQRQRGRNGFDGSTTPLQRQSLAKQLRQFGASRRERGNLCQRENAWWRSQSESNLSQQQLKGGDLAFDRRPKSPFISPPGRPGRCLK